MAVNRIIGRGAIVALVDDYDGEERLVNLYEVLEPIDLEQWEAENPERPDSGEELFRRLQAALECYVDRPAPPADPMLDAIRSYFERASLELFVRMPGTTSFKISGNQVDWLKAPPKLGADPYPKDLAPFGKAFFDELGRAWGKVLGTTITSPDERRQAVEKINELIARGRSQ